MEPTFNAKNRLRAADHTSLRECLRDTGRAVDAADDLREGRLASLPPGIS